MLAPPALRAAGALAILRRAVRVDTRARHAAARNSSGSANSDSRARPRRWCCTTAPRPPRTASVVDLPTMGAREVPLTRFDVRRRAREFRIERPARQVRVRGRVATMARCTARSPRTSSERRVHLFHLHALSPADAGRAAAAATRWHPGHVIDLGVMDDAGGMLVFLDQKTLREGPLYPLAASRFVSGPTLAVAYPFVDPRRVQARRRRRRHRPALERRRPRPRSAQDRAAPRRAGQPSSTATSR